MTKLLVNFCKWHLNGWEPIMATGDITNLRRKDFFEGMRRGGKQCITDLITSS